MTQLPSDGGKRPPIVRTVGDGEGGELVLELTYRTVTLRPKRARDPDAKASLTWGAIYRRALMAAAEERVRLGKRRR